MFALDAALFRISPVPFVRYVDAREFGNRRTTHGGVEFESPPLGRAVSNSALSLWILHAAAFATTSARAQCAMGSKRREEWLQRLALAGTAIGGDTDLVTA